MSTTVKRHTVMATHQGFRHNPSREVYEARVSEWRGEFYPTVCRVWSGDYDEVVTFNALDSFDAARTVAIAALDEFIAAGRTY